MLLAETDQGDRIAVHAAGPMRVAIVRVLPGDRIVVERSPFDAGKGRIVAVRHRAGRTSPPGRPDLADPSRVGVPSDSPDNRNFRHESPSQRPQGL